MSSKRDMKKVITSVQNTIGEAISELEQLISDREDYASERSDSWSDSERGQEYMEATSALQSILDSLENAQSEAEGMEMDA